jgi:thioesterase domain-containing protein/acyl carrier protein
MELLVPERLPALRIAFVGGEAFTGDFTTRWAATCRFFNGYGPTESTVTVVVKECTGVYESSPPIGRAMENHRAYVLDEWLEPVPPGVPGELYIGGAGLARGYLGRPELTAKAFVPDAFSGVPGARLYRTGDLVKWNGEGDLVFLGRVDRQLKIRGIRIEPGEVEQTLERHPAVVAAVVEPWQTPTGTRLAAYVVPGSADGARDGLAEELEAHARRSLIEAMVPSTFVFLDELPLTPSGKVDRAALPHPAPTRRRHVPPATETEHAVAGILGELLDAPEVGMSDSFFELGGHSLLAMQVVRRLRERLGVDVPVTALFTSPTIGALAQAVAERKGVEGGAAGAPLVTLRPGSGSPVVLVHPTGGGVFCYREIVDLLPPGRPVLGFEQSEPWQGTVSQLASSYLDQLAAAGVDRPAVVGGWSFGGVVAHELASLLHERSGALPEALLVDSYSSRDQLGWERPAELARIFVADIVSMTVADVPEPDMPDGDEEAFLVAALAAAHRCGALEELDLDELRRRYAIFRANAIALAQHLPAPYAGPVTLVKASHSVSTATAWRELSGTLESHVLDGDHYSIVRGDGAEEIARLLDALAARATAVAAGV